MTIYTFIDDLLTELQSKGYGTKEVDLFEGPLNLTAINCIAIAPYGGTNPTTIKSGEENPHNPFLNVEIRNQNRQLAYETTIGIYEMWRLLGPVTYGTTRFERIEARGTWHPLGLDKNNCMNYSINFSLIFGD